MPPPPPCSLHHPPHPPTLSLPPPKQTVQMPQLNQYAMKTAVNRQMVALEEEMAASEDIAAEWDQFMDERRRQRRCARRRKRRKDLGLGFGSGEEGSGDDEEDEKWLFGPDRSMTLTKRQEAALSRFIQEGAMLEANNSQFTMESTHYSSSCATTCISSKRSCTRQKILLRARESEERIMTNYIRMVISVAATYEGSGLSFDDLVQEGCVGLLRGVRKFDPKKGNRLSTYVYWWIKQAIVRAIANNSRLVRLPQLCR